MPAKGCKSSRRVQLVGQVFGCLTVVADAGTKRGKSNWECRCVCGKIHFVQSTALSKGHVRSCGCKRNEWIGNGQRTHGMSRHPAFHVWRSMCDRCRLPTHQAWHNYGGRGITVCPEWQESFTTFWADMGPTYQSGLTLDRENNEQGYNKGNCRWTTYKVQGSNRRGNRFVDTEWGRLTVAEASRRAGIGVTTALYRLAHGWTDENTFNVKPDFKNKNEDFRI